MADGAPTGVLLLVDLFSHFRFVDGLPLGQALQDAAPAIAAACATARRRGTPVIFCNDNFRRWHEHWEDILEFTAREGTDTSRVLLRQLRPQHNDIVLLKSRHSAFFQTQLPALLDELQVERIAIAGASTDACVLCTAIDAHIRGLEVSVLEDATAAASPERHRRALAHMRESLGLRVLSQRAWR